MKRIIGKINQIEKGKSKIKSNEAFAEDYLLNGEENKYFKAYLPDKLIFEGENKDDKRNGEIKH